MAVPENWYGYDHGMSLRDYFAGQALVGLLAGQHINPHDYPLKRAAEISAEKSYAIADAMMKERDA
jgi:hypothetical protein